MRELNPKVSVRCEHCGFTLHDYPAKGTSLPIFCPRCHKANGWKEHKATLYLPVHSIGRRR